MYDESHMYGGIPNYATDGSAVKEKPGTSFYTAGVLPRHTAPAKWWNWLFNAITAGLNAALQDKKNSCREMVGLLAAADLVPSNNDNDAAQCAQSYDIISSRNVIQYDARANNNPYASGTTIILPDTELL